MTNYMVEIQRVVTTTVWVEAESPEDAYIIVNHYDYPLPPRGEWDVLEDWDYFVHDDKGNLLEEF